MDERTQKEAIVAKLRGVPLERLPHFTELEEPWRSIYLRVRRVEDRAEADLLLMEATHDREDQPQLVEELAVMLPAFREGGRYPSLAQMAEWLPEVRWLWPSWVPRGMLTLLGAAPGAGKSLVALDLARRVIRGEPFPDGALPPVDAGGEPGPGGTVVIVDAEGAPALVNQRARAWGIDTGRLFLLRAPNQVGLIDLTQMAQQKLLWKMCRTLQPALVIVDSLGAAVPSGETSLEAARQAMNYLTAVARIGDLAMVVIHHLRKRARAAHAGRSRQVTVDDLRGSSHLVAAARSIMALSVVDAAGTRRLEIVKSNLCRIPPPLSLVFEGEERAVPTLRYGEWVQPAAPPTRTALCARWIYEFLQAAGEPVRPVEVVRAAAEAGYSRRLVYRARKSLVGWVVDVGKGLYDPQKRWGVEKKSGE